MIGPEKAAREGGKGTIMLVDDDVILLHCIAELLERFEFHVVARPKAESALEEIAAGAEIDLVITDYKMDGMDGIEFLHRFRHRCPHVPAIVLTGHGTLDGYLKAKGLDVEFLTKPVKAKDLHQTIKNALGIE